ncbi:MAG: tetratricopeptide repeat protein [Betaproteobacteria bacterium]|nr:tetratricopeptide repeat protein [Betaproteobacteria bacterium]
MTRLIVFCGLALLFGVKAAFADACPTAFPLNPPTDQAALTEEAQRLSPLETPCENRADYFAYRGLVALQRGEAAAAVEWLERALLINPNLAGVEVDYARALALAGDRAAAANLARELLARPDLPPAVASWLPQQFQDWSITSDWVSRFSVASLAGYETNLNSAPQNPFVTLTLGSGDLSLQLSPQFQPKRGAAGQLILSGVVGREWGDDALAFIGQAQARGSGFSDTNYQQADLAALWRHAFQDGATLLRVDDIGLRYGGQSLYQSVRLEPDYEWIWGPCRPRVGLLYNTYAYPVAPELNGRYTGVLSGGVCAVGADQIRGQVSLGRDLAAGNDRPGGGEGAGEMTLGWTHPWGVGTLDIQGVLGLIRDDTGYSALLASNATREVTRQYLKVEYDHPLGKSWEFLIYGESNHQNSNVTLFSVTDHGIYAGLRWTAQ